MKKIGIWLDQKEADIISITDNHEELNTIYSDIETRERIPGEGKKFGRFGDQYLNDEKAKKHKIEEQLKKYIDKVIHKVEDAEEILVFGPAQTKIRLEKAILQNPNLAIRLKEVRNADHMTLNQKKAYVREYFRQN